MMSKNYLVNPRTSQSDAYSKTLNYSVNDLLINGDPSVNERDPAGIKYRIDNDAKFVGQTIDPSGGLDVDASDANRYAWIAYVEELFSLVQGGKPDMVVCNKQTLLKWNDTLRRLKLLDVTKDQFDREVSHFHGVPFLDAGMKPAGAIVGGTANQVIGDDTETSPIEATASTTSMYAVKLGPEDFTGLQLEGGLKVEDIGVIGSDPTKLRTHVFWVCGFFTGRLRCIARLSGLDIT